MSLKRKFASNNTNTPSSLEYYHMGSKQSSTAANHHLPTQAKRKRSNTQHSHQIPMDTKLEPALSNIISTPAHVIM
jgi:hypothetical protein